MKYRKKPVTVDAFQWTGDSSQKEDLEWIVDALKSGKARILMPSLFIETLEGTMHAKKGDWIIRGVEGEIYSCKPSIFEKTYEPV